MEDLIKNNKGITLIALIITVIVMLILAGVGLNFALGEGGIFRKTEESAKIYENAQANELQGINEIGKVIDDYMPDTEEKGKWKYDQPTQTVSDGNQTLKIGDYIDYNYTTQDKEYTYGWRVVGADDYGRLLVLSEDYVKSCSIGGIDGYLEAVDKLNTICADYGKGEGAVSARSITIEDIDTITGFNPQNPSFEWTISEETYGNELTITWFGVSGNVGAWKIIGSICPEEEQQFGPVSSTYWDGSKWRTLQEGEEATVKIKNSFYSYKIMDVTEELQGQAVKMDKQAQPYKMIFTCSHSEKEEERNNFMDYYLANSYEQLGFLSSMGENIMYGVRGVYEGLLVRNYLTFNNLERGYDAGVRAIVTLSPDVKVEDLGNKKNDCTIWHMEVNS